MREWNRADLKKKARDGIRHYYLAAVVVSLILSVLGIGMAASNIIDEDDKNQLLSAMGIETAIEDTAGASDAQAEAAVEELLGSWDVGQLLVLGLAILGALAIFGIIGLIIHILVLNVIEVGSCRFYLEGQSGQTPDVHMLLWGFRSGGYGNIVKIMLVRDIRLLLWTLLLVVPGIIKSYEYQMIPWLLTENPHMACGDVFAESREMMTGNKWKTFVLDLSFLGWNILASAAGFVLGLIPAVGDTLATVPRLLLSPYIDATKTELYKALRGQAS